MSPSLFCFENIYYRPKRSFGQGNVFTRVCHSVHRGVPDQAPPPGPGRYTPRDEAGNPPDQAGTPPDQAGTPPGPGRNPPGTRPPPGTADSGIRSTFGRYASYWNAFLFIKLFELFDILRNTVHNFKYL